MRQWIRRRPELVFLLLTFGISLAAGLLAFRIGGASTFESPQCLPLLLLVVWAPNFAALSVWAAQGVLLRRLRSVAIKAPCRAWLLALFPLLVATLLAAYAGFESRLTFGDWSALLALNLMLGPLGEELGWRGFLLPTLVARQGPLKAALTVGAVWALWHLPLWWLPSPHRAIPYWIFFSTVLCFSLLLTTLWAQRPHALGPAVLFHLAANVGVGALEANGSLDAATAYRLGLPFYALAAAVAAAWLSRTAGSASRSSAVLSAQDAVLTDGHRTPTRP